MLNYGEALQDVPDDKILARLKSWNCEWLSRPNIAMSEMAATLKDNLRHIIKHRGTVFTPTFVDKVQTFCDPLLPALGRLDNKDRNSNDPPDKDDVLDVIEAIHKDEATEDMFAAAFNACGPVLMMSIHVLAFNCLLHNPEAFAEQSVKNPSTEALRTEPTKTAINQYLIDSILQKRRIVQRSDDLWDRSQYSATESPQRQTPTRRRRLDTQDDEDPTPGTSGASNTTVRRRLTNVPTFAKPSPARQPTDRRRRGGGEARPLLTAEREEDDDDDEATQLYVRRSADRRSRAMQRKTEARDLPTSFDEEPPKKNKAPLVGPPTAKNKHKRRREPHTDSDSDEQQLPEKTPKRREKVVSSDSDLDDNTLGITPRTPPESPF